MGRLINDLQKYNFVAVQSVCCTEEPRIRRILPKLFPDHFSFIVDSPLRRINFKQKVQMGQVEANVHGLISNVENGIKTHEKYITNFIPLLNIHWIREYRPVSNYLIKEATELFSKIDLCILPGREDIPGRKGDPSWFAGPKSKIKDLESKRSMDISNIMSYNNIRYIGINKIIQIAQKRGIW